MAEQSPFSPNTDEKLILDKVLGDAYLTVKFVAQNIEAIKSVEGNITTIEALGPIADQLIILSGEIALFESIKANYAIIQPVGENIDDVVSVNEIRTEIETVVANIAAITAVSNNIADVTTVSNGMVNVDAVAAAVAQITTVANDIANINALGPISADITALNAISADITSLAPVASDVGTISGSMTQLLELHTAIPTIQQNRDDAVQAAIDSQAAFNAVQLLQPDFLTKSGNLQGLGNTQEALVNLGAIASIADALFSTNNSLVNTPDANTLTLSLPNKLKIVMKRGLTQAVTADSSVALANALGDTFEQPPLVIPLLSPDAVDYPTAGNEKTSVIRLKSSTTNVSGFWFSGNDADSLTGNVIWGYVAIGKTV